MRKEINFNCNWMYTTDVLNEYKITDVLSIFNSKSSDIKIVKKIDLPHFGKQQPLNSSGGRNIQETSWYSKKIPVLDYENMRVILEFEGLMMDSQFYINDDFVYRHKCGYTPAVFDITDSLKTTENQITVRLSNIDNNEIPPGKPQSELDYNYDGGIYRNVKIILMPEIGFSHPLLANEVASGGIFVTTISANTLSAELLIDSHIENITTAEQEINMKHSILDSEDTVIHSTSNLINLTANNSYTDKAEINLLEPQLWAPDSPELYTLISTISTKDDVILDQQTNQFGVRNIFIDYENGFCINDKKITVSGGNYHQSFGQLGNALPENLLRRDARKLKKAGFNHVRTHYPVAKAFIEECDKIGLMLTISNPGWQYFETGLFEQISYQNMRDIIRWLRNHPSIIIWEANLNESHMSEEFMSNMQTLVHEELPYGNIYTGSHSELSDVVYTNIDPDMIADDFYTEFSPTLKPAWVREYGDNPNNWSDQQTVWRTKRAWGEHLMVKQVDRLISTNYEWLTSYTDMYNAKHVAGFGLWPAIEYNRGYHLNPCYGGLLDLQRIPKYSYYFMQSQMSPTTNNKEINYKPMLFIANSGTEYAPSDITVYTNCDYAKLYYNGIHIATESPQNIPIKHPPIVFNGDFRVERNDNNIVIEGYIDDKLVVSEQITGHGVTDCLKITLDEEDVPFTTKSDDIVVVRVEAIDRRGNRVIYGSDEFLVELSSNDGASIIGDNCKTLELGITSFLLRGKNNSLDIELMAALTINQPYKEIAVKPAKMTIKKKGEHNEY